MKRWLLNPFVYLAGLRALIIGLFIMAGITVIAFYSKTHFDGVIDIHYGYPGKVVMYVLEQLIAWVCPIVVFFILALFISKSKFRLIDIAGTLAIARSPMVFASLIGFALLLLQIDSRYFYIVLITIVNIILTIWMIALMYNAFTISFNLKGSNAVVGFIGGLIVAEILSKILNYYVQIYFR